MITALLNTCSVHHFFLNRSNPYDMPIRLFYRLDVIVSNFHSRQYCG